MLPRGIQTKISLTLLALLFIGMVLVDLVLVMTLQSQLIQYEGRRLESFLEQLQGHFETHLLSRQTKSDLLSMDLLEIPFLLPENNCLAVMIEKNFHSFGNCSVRPLLEKNIRNTHNTGQKNQTIVGRNWAVFQRGGKFLITSLPLKLDKRVIGAVGVMVPITPIYFLLRNSQKIFAFYLLVNVIVLSIGGYYLIARIFMKPIKRLVDRAEQYDTKLADSDEDLSFSVRLEDGEFNKLSLALNQMMARISQDREKLKENVRALKQANSELKQAQKEVVRAEKLASVGRLSAGVAHEIGNPIGIILGYLELLKLEDQTSEERKEFLVRAESEILRINAIIKQLLNISRPMKGEPVNLSAHYFLEELIEDIKVQPLLADTQIRFKPLADEDRITADPDLLRQVCLNLLINAADAIKSSPRAENGLIEIKTCHKTSDKKIMPTSPGKLEVRISDNGTGMSESQLDNIFDPFFTTKDPGKGTGLGLSVSLTIVEQMGGRIWAESKADRGTVMVISLPLIKD